MSDLRFGLMILIILEGVLVQYIYQMKNTELEESFGTLSETINGLIKCGYTLDFNVHKECLVCLEREFVLKPDDFQIDKLYRFEGQSNPEDQSILYAISSARFGIKGLLVDGYGISSDEEVSNFVGKLQRNKKNILIQTKSIDPTQQRPEGHRMIYSALVEMNLPGLIDQLRNESTWRESDRNALTIFKTETMRIVLMGLHQHGELKTHKANGVISIQVLQGDVQCNVEQQTVLLREGQMIALQENIDHSVKAIKESFFLITLSMNKFSLAN